MVFEIFNVAPSIMQTYFQFLPALLIGMVIVPVFIMLLYGVARLDLTKKKNANNFMMMLVLVGAFQILMLVLTPILVSWLS